MLKFPLGRWRRWGACTFMHLDDGIGAVQGQVAAQEMADRIRTNLAYLGLLISPEKCEWEVAQMREWVGFIWDTVNWIVSISPKMISKILARID